MSSTDLEKVASHSLRADAFTLDVELAKPPEENIFAADYYEILRIGPQADEETIERVYRTLADRFHPDNPGTGDRQTFLRLSEAYETLSNPGRRAKYNALRQIKRDSARFWLRGREFFDGVRGGQNRRLAVLCLLYRQKISAHDSAGLSILDLERLTGCTREEVTSALWYLCEKKWGTIGESTAYSITVDGFDVVEGKLEDRLEFRALATVCYSPAELKNPAHVEPRFWTDTLPLYFEPAGKIEGDVVIADHYESLGIGPHADEEVIERVYRTLKSRFHPDNPITGDANTFRRITEAYDTLSDQAKRAEYDALRRRSKYSARFRLQGREFFDGIKGEQLRRLAVLCLLYRQAISESPGLTVLDLEQLTGCTREELSSALWYLREKKWAKYGEYTEYSITAAGFDVVENAAQQAAQSRQNAAVTIDSPILNTIAPENQNSLWIAENVEVAQAPAPIEPAPLLVGWGTQFDVSAEPVVESQPAEEPPEEQNVEVAQAPITIEETPRLAEQAAPFEVAAEPVAPTEPTDTKYRSFLSRVRPGFQTAPPENVQVAPPPDTIQELARLAESVAQVEVRAEPEKQEAASWASLIPEDSYGIETQQNRVAETVQPPDEQPVAPAPAQIENAPGPAEQDAPQAPGVIMSNSTQPIAEPTGAVAVSAGKRVILSMGGKGGVGKTSVMTGLAEWFGENRTPVTLLDLDIENKAIGSLTHFFGGRVPKINIHTPAGLDAFVDNLADDAPVVLADMGAGAGHVTHDWFDKMYPDVSEAGVAFTAIGVVTSDPASVESVLNWAAALEDRVAYLIVRNHLTEHADFSYWEENELAQEFRKRFQPAIIRLDYRLADLENAVRNYGVTLGQVACRTTSAAELQKASLVMRAQSYRRRMFAEFDRVKELLLP